MAEHVIPMASVGVLPQLVHHAGTYTVTGTTKIKGSPDAPTKARVYLWACALPSGRLVELVRDTWSDPATGVYSFPQMDGRGQYATIAFYPSNPNDPNASGYMRPVMGLSVPQAEQ